MAALTLWRAAGGRDQCVKPASGARCLFDGYNANPESMGAALENTRLLEGFGSKRAIHGEMRELGDHALALHEELGRSARASGLNDVLFVGPSAKAFARGFGAAAGGAPAAGGTQLHVSETLDLESVRAFRSRLGASDYVLIKGSRGMSLEKALHELSPLDFAEKK